MNPGLTLLAIGFPMAHAIPCPMPGEAADARHRWVVAALQRLAACAGTAGSGGDGTHRISQLNVQGGAPPSINGL